MTGMIKPTQLARLLDISPATLRLWCGKEYAEFFSPSAQGAGGASRSFSDADARIVAWIKAMRSDGVTPNEIILALRSEKENGWRNLPPLPEGLAGGTPIAVVPRSTAVESLKAYEMQLQTVIKERDSLATQLQAANNKNEKLQERLDDLIAREAELRGLLQQYTIAGRRWNVSTVVVAALILGMVLTLIMAALLALHQ